MKKYIYLIIFAFVTLLPFYWMILTAFSKHIFIDDIKLLAIPPYFGNFKAVLTRFPFLIWICNTFFVAIIGSICSIIIGSLAGFSFACLRFKFRDTLFYMLISTMIIPGFILVIPRYFLIHWLGGLDTLWAVTLPFWFTMLCTFLFRQYYYSIPYNILNAARVDGANIWQLYWRIVLPASKPIILAMFVIRFLGEWNRFFWPVIILRSSGKQVLSVGLSSFTTRYETLYNYAMAGSILSLIPILILFLLYQKYVEAGLRMRITF